MRLPGMRHLGLKLLAIAVATLLWLTVAGEQIVERAVRVPLEYSNVPPTIELSGDAPSVVDVRIRGSSGALSRIGPSELVAILDLSAARPGLRLFHLSQADVRAPFGVQVVQVTPSNVWIALERSASKEVPIVPEVADDPAQGYVVGTVTANPPTAEVVGPAGALDEVTAAITEPVSVRNAVSTVSEEVNVGTANPLVRLREPVRARVTVQVLPAPVDWSVSDVHVHARGGEREARISPATVTLRVRGPRERMSLGAEHFEASIDTTGLEPGVHRLKVRVVPPGSVGVVSIDPPEVRVRIE